MDNTHGFERAGHLRFAACICAARPLADRGGTHEEHKTCMTSHVYYILSLLLPWRSSARATVMRVKQDHASRTDIAPLGSFCQKAQLVSQPAFFSVVVVDRVSTGPWQVVPLSLGRCVCLEAFTLPESEALKTIEKTSKQHA